MFLDDQNNPQVAVFGEALRIAGNGNQAKGYAAVCAGVLAQTDASGYPEATRQAIGRLGEKLAGLNGGQPEPETVLHKIATIQWEQAGITGVAALTTADRAGLIDVVMLVSKSIIAAEAQRLNSLVAADTTLPEDWLGPVIEVPAQP